MSETRFEKYKKYRESLHEVKAVNRSSEMVKLHETSVVTVNTNTTSTLPLEEVLGKIEDQEDEKTANRLITKKRIKIAALAAAGLLIIVGITIFAIIAFGGKN